MVAGKSVNIWNLLSLSRRLIISIEKTNIYISTFPTAVTSKMDQNHETQGSKLRQNPPDIGVTSGQKPCTKTIYIVLQTSVAVGLF